LGRYFKESFGWKANIVLLFYPLMLLAMKSVKYGAQTSIYCSVSPDLNDTTG
jgi:hypothetical protein